MSTIRPDIFLIRGDSSSIAFEFTEGGVASDLTGATVFFTAKPTLDADATDAAAVIKVEVTDHVDSDGNPSATQGKTTIPLSASDTSVTPGTYFYDIQVKRVNGEIISIPARKLTVSADVGRRTT